MRPALASQARTLRLRHKGRLRGLGRICGL